MFCNACNTNKSKSSFSKNQKKKSLSLKRCKACVSSNTQLSDDKDSVIFCSLCEEYFTHRYFSNTQMKKQNQRKCRNCVGSNTSNISFSESSVKSAIDSLPLPYEDIIGEWVHTQDFEGRKSFAYYYCSELKCNKSWMSSRGLKEFGQQCKACNADYELPKYMWQNASYDESSVDSVRDSLAAPKEGMTGEWIDAEQYEGRKSYAYFHCSECGKWWMASKWLKTDEQQCSECCVCYELPMYLWMYKKYLEDNNLPHMKEHCEACQRGVCYS